MPNSPARRPCSTCSRAWAEEEFYANCSECKTCKRARSRRNRAEQARKVAVAERLVEVLALLARTASATPGEPVQRSKVAV